MGDNGFIALGIFLLLLISTILSARMVRKSADRAGFYELYCYGYMLEVAILAYAVSGAFFEFASFDLFYQLIAITIVAKVLLKQKLIVLQKETASTLPVSGRQPQRV